MFQHVLGSPFWQSFAGSLLANAIFALLLSTAVISFAKSVAKQIWSERQMVRLWLTIPVFIYLGLLAIRYNTVSYKESAIVSLRQSVDELNSRLAPRHLTKQQADCLAQELSKGGPDKLPLNWAAASPESFGFANDLAGAYAQAHWTIPNPANSIYPIPGIVIFVNGKKVPPAAEISRRALAACGIPFSWRPDPQIADWIFYVGQKP